MSTPQADLSSVAGQIAAAHQQQTSNSSQARDGISDRHERAVQGWGHPPHRLVPTHTGQPKLSHHGAKHSTRPHHLPIVQHQGAPHSIIFVVNVELLLVTGERPHRQQELRETAVTDGQTAAWGTDEHLVSNTLTTAPMFLAVPMADRPATPPPMTSTLAGGTRPAAVIWPVKNRPNWLAASTTALQEHV
ncbi:MAG: hypothetical protein FRX49_04400 [Trebouxia sp. A1-2]|nr:MAG: hypothetical protein FRX49_04400 [Trebouxia sp. A1-2]